MPNTSEVSTSPVSCDFDKMITLFAGGLRTNELNSDVRSNPYYKQLHKFLIQDRYGLPALLWAARTGHEALIRLLLGLGVEPNERSLVSAGATPLCEAVAYGQAGAVELLLENFADPNVRDLEGRTAIHYAFYPPKIAQPEPEKRYATKDMVAIDTMDIIISLLVDADGDVNIQDWGGRTALHFAIMAKSEEKVRLLLDSGANPDIVDQDGNTALRILLFQSFPNDPFLKPVAELLAVNSLDIDSVDSAGRTALQQAVEFDLPTAVAVLLENGANPNLKDHRGNSALQLVYRSVSRPVPMYQLLLNAGGDIETLEYCGGTTTLRKAVEDKIPDLVEFLLNSGANARHRDIQDHDVLHLALTHCEDKKDEDKDYWRIIDLLIEKLSDFDTGGMDDLGNTALHRAAKLGFRSTVELLLEKGANTEMRNKNGGTALHEVANLNSWWSDISKAESIANLLLDWGASINAMDSKGYTPLCYAGETELGMGHSLARLLLDRGADQRKYNEMMWEKYSRLLSGTAHSV